MMSDPEDNPASTGVPERQRGASDDDHAAETAPKAGQVQKDKLEAARRFLHDDEVKAASRGKKIAFLKSKDIGDADIHALLSEAPEEAAAVEAAVLAPWSHEETEPSRTTTPASQTAPAVPDTPAPSPARSDRPPVLTYPEFLAKPERPPPLVTTNGLLNTLYVFAGLSTILYGASKFVVAPMVENLTDARCKLHETASKQLEAIVSKLEQTVSVIPPYKAVAVAVAVAVAGSDEASDVDDPSEMFHRDVGTQTSLPATPSTPAKQAAEPGSKPQADRLSRLSKSLSGLQADFRTESSSLHDIMSLLNVFRDDLDGMAYGSNGDFSAGGFDLYGKLKRSEPEDETRKVRDSIRRIKGVLLSTRNFPASTR